MCIQIKENKLASLETTLVRKYDPPSLSLTGVKCRATSVAKNATKGSKEKFCSSGCINRNIVLQSERATDDIIFALIFHSLD